MGPREQPSPGRGRSYAVSACTSLTAGEYLTRQEWWKATPPPCPYHEQGGCELRPHGTYARVAPQGLRVRRFLCPGSGRTVSLLPACMAARCTGTLREVEATVRAVEAAGDQPVRWRDLHRGRAAAAARALRVGGGVP